MQADWIKIRDLELGLGLLSIGRSWGVARSEPPGEAAAHALLETAVALGIRIFDTAPAYAASEARLGRFLAALDPVRRSGLVIMTKAGEHWNEAAGTSFVDHSRDALVRSIDRSLALLGRIDVLQIHKATRDVVRDAGVLGALDYARSCGIGAFGASVSDLEAGRAALESGVYGFLQFPFSSGNRTFAPLLPALRTAGAVAIVNRPFAMGAAVQHAEDRASAATDAFRFIRQEVAQAIVLTGTGKVAHLVENVAAFRR